MSRLLRCPALEVAVNVSGQRGNAVLDSDPDLVGLDAGLVPRLAEDLLLKLFIGLHRDGHGWPSFLGTAVRWAEGERDRLQPMDTLINRALLTQAAGRSCRAGADASLGCDP